MTFDVTISIADVCDEVEGEQTLTLTVSTAQELREKLTTVLEAQVQDVL